MKKPLIKGVVCVFLLLVFMQSMSQNAAIYKSIRLDTTKVISMEQMVKIATRFYDRHYKSIYDAKEKIFVDENIRKLDAGGADQYHLAQGLSSSSVLLTGTGQSLHISLVFSAKAVIAFPKDTLIVNNFGAVLRMLDSVKTSLPVLLYAKSLYPGAPVILTNLGNTLFELNDDRSAENFYTQSLKINPDFALARHGLVNVYLKRKDFQKALEELYKGVSGMYSQSLHEAHDKLKANEKYHPPREPVGDNPETQASGANSNAPDPNAQIENLHFPKFPDWDNITTFLKDKTIGNIIKTTTHGMDVSIDNKLGEFADLANMTPEQQAAWAENFKKRWNEKENTPGKILYKKNFFCMDLLAAYFENELKEENKRYLTSDSLNNAKFHASLEKIRESDRKAMEQMKGDMPQIQAFMIESCHRITELVDETYDGWRVNAAERHNRYDDLLTEYWIYCEQYLNRTYDPVVFGKLNSTRKVFVYSYLSPLYREYQARQLVFAALNMSAFATVDGECPKMPPPPPPPITNADDIEVPDKEVPECPFKDGKFKIGMGACSIGLDCESIEGECAAGMAFAGKWNYKKKEFSGFAGVGAKADFGAGKVVGVSAEVKSGIEFTYNTKNQNVDYAIKTEGGIKGSVGNVEAGKTMEVKITGATSVNVEMTNELTVSF